MKYIVITAESFDDLQKRVNEKIDEGYIPHGNLVVNNYRHLPSDFIQAMIRKNLIIK